MKNQEVYIPVSKVEGLPANKEFDPSHDHVKRWALCDGQNKFFRQMDQSHLYQLFRQPKNKFIAEICFEGK